MRFLHFATEDTRGGAAKAGYCLHVALREPGHSPRMFVRNKSSHDPDFVEAPVSGWRSRFQALLQWMRLHPHQRFRASYQFDTDAGSVADVRGLPFISGQTRRSITQIEVI